MQLGALFRFVRRPEVALTVFGAFLSYACSGCLSNQYTIPSTELTRLAQLPPEQRGQRVQVVQGLGERRAEAIDGTQPPPPVYDQGQGQVPPPEGYVEDEGPHVGVGLIVAPPPVMLPVPGPGLGHGYHSGPTGRIPMGRAAPSAPKPAPAAGGSKLPGGKGGGSGKDDLIAAVVVLALLATVGMIATEGARYDGPVALYPWQPVHLTDQNGQQREVPLAELTPADAATSKEALVMDDEGWGMMRLGRRPLDRKGFAFKLDVGAFLSSPGGLDTNGTGFGLQFGFFPHRMVGLLGSWRIAGGTNANDNSFSRNNLAFELQFLPLSLSRLHLGGFGHVGQQWATNEGLPSRQGLAVGGGGLLEIALTTRLALAFRVDYTSAKVGYDDQPWQSGLMITGGVAIY